MGRGGPSRRRVNERLLTWFDARGRRLAFRSTRDPYAVLVAEVMLHQTQATRIEPSWRAFLERFPTVETLAAAPAGEVLRAWAGLGYYGRAVRLQRAARVIVQRHGGRVPDAVGALEALPGVGRYTARAVAAIAFGARVAAVDTNVGRVVRRLFGVPDDAAAAARVQALADALVDPHRPGDWTHALMDVGATLCRPRRPRCGECPLEASCRTAGKDVARERVRSRRGASVAFATTRRWLRGRLLARLRGERPGRWVRVEGPVGEQPPAAVEEALRALAADGLIERDSRGLARFPP